MKQDLGYTDTKNVLTRTLATGILRLTQFQ